MLVVDISGNGKRAVFGAYLQSPSDHASYSMCVSVHENRDGEWVQLGNNLGDRNHLDFLQVNVAIAGDGNSVIIGSNMKRKERAYKYESEK